MIAIREIQQVKDGKVTVYLPSDFGAQRVEIIILPVEDAPEDVQSLQDLLLEMPTITDDEFQEYVKVREWMNQWRVAEF